MIYMQLQIVDRDAWGDAQRLRSRNHVCSSVENVAPSAYVCLLGHMETSICALATTTGRPREEAPSALSNITRFLHHYHPYGHIYLFSNLAILSFSWLATRLLSGTDRAAQFRLSSCKSFMV